MHSRHYSVQPQSRPQSGHGAFDVDYYGTLDHVRAYSKQALHDTSLSPVRDTPSNIYLRQVTSHVIQSTPTKVLLNFSISSIVPVPQPQPQLTPSSVPPTTQRPCWSHVPHSTSPHSHRYSDVKNALPPSFFHRKVHTQPSSMKPLHSNTRQTLNPVHFPCTLKIRLVLLALQIVNYLRDDHPRHVEFKKSLREKEGQKSSKKTAPPRPATTEADMLARTRERPYTHTEPRYGPVALYPSRTQDYEAWKRMRAVSHYSQHSPGTRQKGEKNVRFGAVIVHDSEGEDEEGGRRGSTTKAKDEGKKKKEFWGPKPVKGEEGRHELWGPARNSDGMLGEVEE